MKLEITNKQQIEYLEKLVREDVELHREKLERREKVHSSIIFAHELGDFHT